MSSKDENEERRGIEVLLSLVKACEEGNADQLRGIMSSANFKPEDLLPPQKDRGVPLVSAATGGHADCVELLLEHMPETQVALPASCPYLSLFGAVLTGSDRCIELLLRHSPEAQVLQVLGPMADVAVEASIHGCNALAMALLRKSCVAALLRSHAPAAQLKACNECFRSALCPGWSALHVAAQLGWDDIVDLILAHDAEEQLRSRDSSGTSPLALAADMGNAACVRRLLDAILLVDPQMAREAEFEMGWGISRYPVVAAAGAGHLECVKIFLDLCPNIWHPLPLDLAIATMARSRGGGALIASVSTGQAAMSCLRHLSARCLSVLPSLDSGSRNALYGTFTPALFALAAEGGNSQCLELVLAFGSLAAKAPRTPEGFTGGLLTATYAPYLSQLVRVAEGTADFAAASWEGHRRCIALLLAEGIPLPPTLTSDLRNLLRPTLMDLAQKALSAAGPWESYSGGGRRQGKRTQPQLDKALSLALSRPGSATNPRACLELLGEGARLPFNVDDAIQPALQATLARLAPEPMTGQRACQLLFGSDDTGTVNIPGWLTAIARPGAAPQDGAREGEGVGFAAGESSSMPSQGGERSTGVRKIPEDGRQDSGEGKEGDAKEEEDGEQGDLQAAQAGERQPLVESAQQLDSDPDAQPILKICASCGATEVPLKKCTGCHTTRYCSPKCQTRHWKVGGHKVECKALSRKHKLQVQEPPPEI